MGFFDILIHPRETMEQEKSKSSLNAAIKTFVIYYLIVGLLAGIGITILTAIGAGFLGPMAGAEFWFWRILINLGYLAIVIVPILAIIFGLICTMIGTGIYWLIAKAFGGTGTFTENYYLMSKLVWQLLVLGIVISLLGLIPILGAIITLLWLLYVIYLAVILISVANKISTIKALIVVLIPVIIAFILSIALLLALIATLISPQL
jgi:hypothetical protein